MVRKNVMLKALNAIRDYYEKHGTWELPEGLVVDSVNLLKWWNNTKTKLQEGTLSDTAIYLILEKNVDFGFKPLLQSEWYDISREWIRKHGELKKTDVYKDYYKIGVWYYNYQSGKLKDRLWFSQLETFKRIWNSKNMYKQIPYICNQTPWYWIMSQYKKIDNFPYYKVQALEALDIPWEDPLLIEETIKNKIKEPATNLLEKQLQVFLESGDMNGVSAIEPIGILSNGKNLRGATEYYYLCEAYINTMFTEEQYIAYVDKVKKSILKEAKKLVIKKRKNSSFPIEPQDIKLHQMTSNRKKHIVRIIFHIDGQCFEKEEIEEDVA